VPDSALAGKILEEIAAIWNVTPVAAYMRIVKATSAEVGISQSMEAIIGRFMSRRCPLVQSLRRRSCSAATAICMERIRPVT
jgi:hypothetical protein